MARSKTEEQKATEAAALAAAEKSQDCAKGAEEDVKGPVDPIDPVAGAENTTPIAEGEAGAPDTEIGKEDGAAKVEDSAGDPEDAIVDAANYQFAGCCRSYIPVELRTKLEETAIKMLDNLANYAGEYNENQLSQIREALEIYSRIKC